MRIGGDELFFPDMLIVLPAHKGRFCVSFVEVEYTAVASDGNGVLCVFLCCNF